MADRRRLAIALAWVVALSAGAATTAAPPADSAHAVAIEDMRFSPPTLQVRSGERIVWTNKDLVPHTVTARDGSFDSHAIAPGASWSLVAAKAGTVDYACIYHPAMTARLAVR